MQNMNSSRQGYLPAAIAGALIGGLLVLVMTKAIPTMLSQLMRNMMTDMCGQMGECGCNPAEMCACMAQQARETPAPTA
ncbi:hypothetical protein TFLX_03668 [Thermoflexales bacterium]|nr:hypothetical protein TFLX_03668 [Thermoflexales bacterium]